MHQHYILTQHPDFQDVINWVGSFPLQCEFHLNRTRFWVPDGSIYTEFALRWAHACPRVDPTLDLATGLPFDYRDIDHDD
jgi:hypothetical protein